MSFMRRFLPIWVLTLTAVVAGPAARAQAWPEVDKALKPLVESQQLAGVVTLALHKGRIAHASALGQRDLASGAPMQRDTIFRAFSMTKPVTAVAMMILFDEGKWQPSDPIARFLPELAELKVFRGLDANGKPLLDSPRTPPTMAQLLTHTAGFSYGFNPGYVDDLYRAVGPLASRSADELVGKLATLPLRYEPGTEWQYSLSMDVQGAIIERLAGMSLSQFMARRIFQPLRMKDTAFQVPADKRARFATLYTWKDSRLAAQGDPSTPDYALEPGFASGGGGLVTTADDYARLGQMLLNDGTLNGVRILRPGSARRIMTDHLPPALVNGKFGIGFQQLRPGYQYGYNGVVVTDPVSAGVDMGRGSYLWDGAAGTWFWIDPANQVVFVGMVQRIMSAGGMPQVQKLSQQAVRKTLRY